MPSSPKLASVENYEYFIYSLPDAYSNIRFSTLVVIRVGTSTAIVRGEIHFKQDLILCVLEFVDFHKHRIRHYSYDIYQHGEKIRWYDPWPHPTIPALISTHPHHVHVPPDIKHNRKPAPGFSFTRPNIPLLIREILTIQRPTESTAGRGST